MSYGEYRPARGENVVQLHVGENPPQQYNVSTKQWQQAPDWLGRQGHQTYRHSRLPIYLANVFDVGIFKDTLAPSLALHSGLAAMAWGVGRQYDYLAAKDWLWPGAQVVNMWWSAVGRRLARGEPFARISRTISWPEQLLLVGVSAWGARRLFRLAARSRARDGADDPKYAMVKRQENFWNKALLTTFLPEALLQAVIALPFTAPFRHQGGVMSGYHPFVQSVAVGLFSAGFALEILSDDHRTSQHVESFGLQEEALQSEGVYSIVRHPYYLGDALIHLSFPLLLFGSDMLAPVELLGPLTNYIYLRYFADDAQSEFAQPQGGKNAIWPAIGEIQNQWTWIVVGIGAAGALLEQGLRRALH